MRFYIVGVWFGVPVFFGGWESGRDVVDWLMGSGFRFRQLRVLDVVAVGRGEDD